MRVKFLQDFGGRETNDLRYVAGQVADFEREVAEQLVHDGRAVAVDGQEMRARRIVAPRPDEDPAPRRKRGKK